MQANLTFTLSTMPVTEIVTVNIRHYTSDKGNGVVIHNKKEYVAKMNVILNDQSKFKKIVSDNSLSNLTHFQRSLARLKNKKALSPEDNQRIRPTSTTIPTLFRLPKSHKDNNPMRPI